MDGVVRRSKIRSHSELPEASFGDRLSLLTEQLKVSRDFGGYSISYSPLVMVGDFDPSSVSGDHMVISPKGDSQAYSMEYALHLGGSSPKIVLRNLQRSSRYSFEKLSATLDGQNPAEVLVSDFLRRAKPVFELRPETELVLVGESFSMESTVTDRVYKPLRDRFFTKDWRLALDKKRVREVLGVDLCQKMKQARKDRG